LFHWHAYDGEDGAIAESRNQDMPPMNWLLVEEILDSVAVAAVAASAVFWWQSSRVYHAESESGATIRARLNGRAATCAAIATALQSLAVLTHICEIAS
jgi:hypothetical protein